MSSARRLSTAAVVTLLLVGGASCSKSEQPPAPGATSAPTAGATGSVSPAPTAAVPTTAAPGPSGSASPTSTLPPAATTPVPPPSPGTTEETVSAKPEVTKKPVKLDKPSDAGGGVQVRISAVKAITAKAQLPGEVAGPAVSLTLVVKNGSDQAVNLDTVVVTLLNSDQAPGIEMTAKPAAPFSGTLKAGKSTTGVYVFTVGRSLRNPISVNVTLNGEAPVLLFKGNAK